MRGHYVVEAKENSVASRDNFLGKANYEKAIRYLRSLGPRKFATQREVENEFKGYEEKEGILIKPKTESRFISQIPFELDELPLVSPFRLERNDYKDQITVDIEIGLLRFVRHKSSYQYQSRFP